ncbi:MAG: MFS transporter, partial [Microbacterium sp.]
MTTVTAPYRLWHSVPYLIWLAGDTATGLARALAAFAIPLLALMATGDPALAGIIGAVAMVVRLVTTLAGGVLADRHRRLALMVIGGLVGVVVCAGFTVLAVADALTFGALAAVAALLALRGGLFDVAGESALKQLVPD